MIKMEMLPGRSLALPIRSREDFIGRATLCGAAKQARPLLLQEALNDRAELLDRCCRPQLSVCDNCAVESVMLRPICFARNFRTHAKQIGRSITLSTAQLSQTESCGRQ